jgi:hypothetical protein
MSPRHTLTARAVWPMRGGRIFAPAGGRKRLPWLPLSMAWRRMRMARAASPAAASTVPGGVVRLALSIAYRLDWSLHYELAPPRAPARSPARVPVFARSASKTPSATRVDPAESTVVRSSLTRRIQVVRLAEAHRSSRLASQIDVPVALMHRKAARPIEQPSGQKPAPSRQHASRLPASRARPHTSAARWTTPAARASRSPRIEAGALRGEGAARGAAPALLVRVHRSPLMLATPRAAQSNRDIREQSYAAARHRVELGWREKPTQAGERMEHERTLAGQRTGESPVVPAPTAHSALAASERPFARMLEPAIAERLVEDVIRRVDRRMRIERERRGL